jgi:alkylhydroperoxidase family enzyme
MKTSMSRFQIHDDLTAPEGSIPVLRGALATGGQLPNFLGVLAGSPAALRAYARFRDEREAALLRYLKALLEERGRAPMYLHEEAREAGWNDEQILEAIAAVALESFTAMVNVAGEIPVDGSSEASRVLQAA